MSSKNDWLDFLEHRMIINNYLAHHGVEGMHWGVRRYQPYSTVPRKSGKGGKELINKSNDQDVQAMIDSDIFDMTKQPTNKGTSKSKMSIKYKTDEQGDLRANTSFGNCKDCLLIIEPGDPDFDEPGGRRQDVELIINDNKFEESMRRTAADSLYEYRLGDSQKDTYNEYKRKLRCEQITAHTPGEVSVWYHHPDDFGDCLLTIDTKKKKIISSEGYS